MLLTGWPSVAAADLADALASDALALDDIGWPVGRALFVDLDSVDADAARLGRRIGLRAVLDATQLLVIGVSSAPLSPLAAELADALLLTLVPSGAERGRAQVGVRDVEAAADGLAAAIAATPRAASALRGLLRITVAVPVAEGLVAESAVYSMLLAGTEFARWRASVPRRPERGQPGPAVLLGRVGDRLNVTINNPGRHNAFNRFVRDGLAEAFDLAAADPSISCVVLKGSGPSFCSGGDLDEFGTTADVSTAHLIRLDRSVAARLDRCRDRVEAVLHGACIGAGIEIPSFAGRVVARSGAFFQLPELAMGLVPGAGGTVSITRRIGPWRTAYLALTGVRLDPPTALDWGLVDLVER